jgi:hypothetical protein
MPCFGSLVTQHDGTTIFAPVRRLTDASGSSWPGDYVHDNDMATSRCGRGKGFLGQRTEDIICRC